MHNKLITSTPDQALKIRIRDILLNALAVSSGAIDAVSFLDLGKVFSAFMTGNIAFLGLRAAHAAGPDWTNIFAAVFGFTVGVYLSTRIVRPSEASGIWSQRVTVALCLSLIAHAAFLSVWFASNGRPSVGVVPVLLGSWGFRDGDAERRSSKASCGRCVYNCCDRNHHISCGRPRLLVRDSKREAAAYRRARLVVRRRDSRRPALGSCAHLCPGPTIRDHRRGGRNRSLRVRKS